MTDESKNTGNELDEIKAEFFASDRSEKSWGLTVGIRLPKYINQKCLEARIDGATYGYTKANEAYMKMYKTDDTSKSFEYVEDLIGHLKGDINMVKVRDERTKKTYMFCEMIDVSSDEYSELVKEAKIKAMSELQSKK
jgi:hypothetical protein